MSLTPNQQGVGRLLRFLDNSYVLARQEANNDESSASRLCFCTRCRALWRRVKLARSRFVLALIARNLAISSVRLAIYKATQRKASVRSTVSNRGSTKKCSQAARAAVFSSRRTHISVTDPIRLSLPIGSHKSDRSGALPMRSPALGRSRPTPQTGATDGPCGGVPLRNVWVPRHHGLAADRCTGRIHYD